MHALSTQGSDSIYAPHRADAHAPVWWVDGQILDAYVLPVPHEDRYELPPFRGAAICRVPHWRAAEAVCAVIGEPSAAADVYVLYTIKTPIWQGLTHEVRVFASERRAQAAARRWVGPGVTRVSFNALPLRVREYVRARIGRAGAAAGQLSQH